MVLLVHGVVQPLASKVPLVQNVAKHLAVPRSLIENINIVRRSVDARKRRGNTSAKVSIRLVYNVHVHLTDNVREAKLAAWKGGTVAKILEEIKPYEPTWLDVSSDDIGDSINMRPIVVGSGPAGLFAAYTLVRSGFKPIVIEMGPHVERRSKDIMKFWKDGILTPNSNGVFGEGGAGAFSDGKLTTRTSSAYHRFVHETLIEYGAKSNILYESRAHVGTDQLRKIITNFSRDGIAAAGATFLYNNELVSIDRSADGSIGSIVVKPQSMVDEAEVAEFNTSFARLVSGGSVLSSKHPPPYPSSSSVDADRPATAAATSIPTEFTLKAANVFLATGHSSRPIFQHLHDVGAQLVQKDFAVGLRLQISQKYVNELQYGDEGLAGSSSSSSEDAAECVIAPTEARRLKEKAKPVAQVSLGPAEFTLKYRDKETGRSVYTFCMCPGGVIVNASHGGQEVAVNGMSYSTRASRFANAAIVATVGGDDFKGYGPRGMGAHGGEDCDDYHPLQGMYFQQHWEHECFKAAGGDYAAPAQRVTDFLFHHRQYTESLEPESSAGGASASASAFDTSLPDNIFMGKLQYANLSTVLPTSVNTAIANALCHFAKHMPLIVDRDTLLVGIESRTSSPVRIDRDEVTLESTNIKGLYPVGEGAGYAGGIMTACVDGVRAVEAMIAKQTGDGSGATGDDVEKCVRELRSQRNSGHGSSW